MRTHPKGLPSTSGASDGDVLTVQADGTWAAEAIPASSGLSAADALAVIAQSQTGGCAPSSAPSAMSGWGVLGTLATSDATSARGVNGTYGAYFSQNTSATSGNAAYTATNNTGIPHNGKAVVTGRVEIVESADFEQWFGASGIVAVHVSTAASLALFRYDASTDTNVQFVHNNGGTPTVVDTTVVGGAGVYDWMVIDEDGGTTWRWALRKNGAASWTTGTVTTNLPAGEMGPLSVISTQTTAAKTQRTYLMAVYRLASAAIATAPGA